MVTFLTKPLEMNQISAFQWTEVEKKFFTETQVEIFEMKYGKKANQEIITKFSLNSNSNIYASVKSTKSCDTWKLRVDQGGRPSYLSNADVVLFESKISHSCYDLECLSIKQAM
ncbi:hypothetical protein M9Y10_004176 [Tritrichomonas musculus]|uniref:Uncharacterized protein n=1 Tax=Tritrichomonas musculus TaxID=1915356 RepID=A0ABR2JRN7_9EUKA